MVLEKACPTKSCFRATVFVAQQSSGHAVSVKIGNAKTNTKGEGGGASSTFCIGRGGTEAIPIDDMWRDIAGLTTDDWLAQFGMSLGVHDEEVDTTEQ
jgi:hypothetical protein